MTGQQVDVDERKSESASLMQWTKRLLIPLTVLAWLALGVLIWWMASYVVGAIVIFSIAALLATALHPAVKLIQRFLPRGIAIISAFLAVFLVLCLVLYLLISITVDQVTLLSQYIREWLSNGTSALGPLTDILSRFGISNEQLLPILQQLLGQLQGLLRNLAPFLGRTFGLFINILLVAALSIYMLFAGPRIINWLRYKTPLLHRPNVNFLLDTLYRVVGGYIRGQLLMSFVLSTITGIVMAIIGVPLAFFLGVLAFVLSFIPTLGAFITGTLCVLLALTQGWVTALLALGFLIFLQILEGQVLSPRILGSAVGLHPLVALGALVVGSELFGTAGALFAAPLAGIIQALLLSIWSTWREYHPEQFLDEDDAHFVQAVEREEKSK
ncbi:MAG: AI-2E family transporter [Ktedonobacteraceae bacterium]|nr:AI-2E family transporter [Ktedonobacteraceae bacterium]